MLKHNGAPLRMIMGVTLILVGLATVAEAQQGRNNPLEFLESSRESAQAGWDYLMIAAAFVIGGGSLAVGGRALFRGDWTHGAIGLGFGVLVLLVLWGLGGFFGFNGQ